MSFIFFVLLSISTTISWFRFYPRNASERATSILILIVMIILIFFYSSSINLLGYLLTDTEGWKKKYMIDFGLLPYWANASVFLLHVIAGVATVVATLIMARYQNKGRVWLMRLIPVVALTQGVAFYWGYGHEHGIEKTQNTLLLFVMISLLIHAAIFLFFDSVKVRKFFNAL